MEIHGVVPGSSGWRQLKHLYETAFPAAERRSLFRMWLLSVLRRDVSLQGWFEGSTLFGLTVTVCSSSCLYLAYIAVAEDHRSCGIGGQMLSGLSALHPGLPLLVEIEDPLSEADNREQRLRRAAFYERSGFHPLDRTITGGGVLYRLYTTGSDYSREAYFALLRRLSFR